MHGSKNVSIPRAQTKWWTTFKRKFQSLKPNISLIFESENTRGTAGNGDKYSEKEHCEERNGSFYLYNFCSIEKNNLHLATDSRIYL